jgi:hypothetical protein
MAKRQNANSYTRPKNDPDPAEVWAEKTNELCAMAMVNWLRGSVHLSRTISSLKLPEVKALAAVACHTWIVEASHRVKVEPDPVQRDKLKMLLN